MSNGLSLIRLVFLVVLVILYLVYKPSFSTLSLSSSTSTSSTFLNNDPFESPYQPKPFRQRIVAIGDLHGDLDRALTTLRLAGIVDNNASWAAGQDIFVQTGDIIDRGPDTIPLYSTMQRLRSEAARAGGAVVSLLGNHEFMNVLGDWRYVTPDEIDTFYGESNRRLALSSHGWLGQEWLANYSVNARVEYPSRFPPFHKETKLAQGAQSPLDNQAFMDLFKNSALHFVHGGISINWASSPSNKLTPVDNVNNVGHSFFERAANYLLRSGPGYHIPPSTPSNELDFYSATGPVWYRGYSLPPETEEMCAEARDVASKLNVKRLIVGHTVQDTITSRCNGLILNIDTGISRAYNGVPSAAEFTYTLSPLPVQQPAQSDQEPVSRQWLEVELVRSIAANQPKPVQLFREERIIELKV